MSYVHVRPSRTSSPGSSEATAGPPPRITPNLFGISFGVAGLAEAWSAAADLFTVPGWVATVLWLSVAALWLGTAAIYGTSVWRSHRLRAELVNPVTSPFIALALIVPMLLGAFVGQHHVGGVVLWCAGLTTTVAFGGWISGQWILSDLNLSQWHPGYFLPTVAGGLLAAASSAQLGYRPLAEFMFGYGVICWLVLGSILLQRLFTQPLLPKALVPTMAIEVAPPVVAGIAWFSINRGKVDQFSYVLAGYAVLMVLVQFRLVHAYLTVPFGPGWWAFAFSYAAVFVDAIHWLAAEHVTHGLIWTYLLLAVVTAGMAALALRTALALSNHQFLPARPAGGALR